MSSQGTKGLQRRIRETPLLKKLRAVEIDHVTQRKERPHSLRDVEYKETIWGLNDGQEEALTRVQVAHDGNPLSH